MIASLSTMFHSSCVIKVSKKLTKGLVQVLQKRLGLGQEMANNDGEILLRKWRHLTTRIERLHDTVSVVLVGKYTSLQDSYISVVKSLEHAALSCSRRLVLEV
jgi:CTP synthase